MESDGVVCTVLDLKDLPRLALAAELNGTKPQAVRVLNAAEHERRWHELRDRADATGEAFEGGRQEWEVILEALAEARLTGRIGKDFAHRLFDALADTLRGHPPAAWTSRGRGHPKASRGEERLIVAAQRYAHAAAAGIVEDPAWPRTVQETFGISPDTYRSWMRRRIDPSLSGWFDVRAMAEAYGNADVARIVRMGLKGAAERYRERRRSLAKVRRTARSK